MQLRSSRAVQGPGQKSTVYLPKSRQYWGGGVTNWPSTVQGLEEDLGLSRTRSSSHLITSPSPDSRIRVAQLCSCKIGIGVILCPNPNITSLAILTGIRHKIPLIQSHHSSHTCQGPNSSTMEEVTFFFFF